MKLVFLLLFFFSCVSFAQPLKQFNEEKSRTDKALMLTLGSWAISNFIVSGIGCATVPKGEAHYFYQMNVMWNTINIGLAIPGYLKAKKEGQTANWAETIQVQGKTENIFLINSGLDLIYVSSGFVLRNLAENDVDKKDQYNGFGNGIILQGGFLFFFDLTAFSIHKFHAKKSLNKTDQTIEMSSNGLGLKWNLGTKPFSRKQVFL